MTVKNVKARLEEGSVCGADPVRIRHGAASIKGDSRINNLLGQMFKEHLLSLQDTSSVTIIVKGEGRKDVLGELGRDDW